MNESLKRNLKEMKEMNLRVNQSLKLTDLVESELKEEDKHLEFCPNNPKDCFECYYKAKLQSLLEEAKK